MNFFNQRMKLNLVLHIWWKTLQIKEEEKGPNFYSYAWSVYCRHFFFDNNATSLVEILDAHNRFLYLLYNLLVLSFLPL